MTNVLDTFQSIWISTNTRTLNQKQKLRQASYMFKLNFTILRNSDVDLRLHLYQPLNTSSEVTDKSFRAFSSSLSITPCKDWDPSNRIVSIKVHWKSAPIKKIPLKAHQYDAFLLWSNSIDVGYKHHRLILMVRPLLSCKYHPKAFKPFPCGLFRMVCMHRNGHERSGLSVD